MSHVDLSLRLPNAATPLKERLAVVIAAAILSLRQVAHRRELAGLSDRQLQDAGIDRSLAGHGKAAAVSAATLRRLQSLSFG